MKKFLLFLLCSLILVIPASAYTVKSGDTPYGLWGVNWKTELAKYGISDPTKLPVGLEVGEKKLGLAPLDVLALYEDNLAVGITSADTSFTVVRGTDKEGTLLNGTFGFILDEGTTLEEFIIGTASGTSITAVERGISVVDGKTQIAGNKKAHRKGASIKMTNYPILGRLNSIITGKESTGSSTFMIGDDTNQLRIVASTTKTIYSIGNTGNPFLRYNGTNWQFSDDGVNTTNLVTGGSGLSASSTKGIEITDSKIGINASSTTGMSFDSNGALYQKVSSSLYSDSDGIGVTVNTLVAGGVATSTPTANMIPIASSTGYLDSWLSTSFKNNLKASFITGETVTAGNALCYKDDSITSAGATKTSQDATYTVNTTNWISQSFITTASAQYIKTITVKTDGGGNLYGAIYAVDVNEKPTGSELARTTVNTGTGVLTLTFANYPSINSNTVYALVLKSSGGDTYPRWDNGLSGYAPRKMYSSTNSGSTWSEQSDSSIYFAISEITYIPFAVYKTSASSNNVLANNFIGFATNNANTSSEVIVDINGISNTQSGLTKGVTYYLSDTAGAISTSAGSQSRKIGLSVSSTAILIKHDNP